ncbi:hypothetical protein STCU_05769 [Strigomonas culicis]|uniref:Uncharacterized protein n=1 Tax=Strigomonas culicis TaxID=28005 RepID=S9U9F4_9TRYP|nr:hypothetical protein STCU_05769 [Strigomonas culicis]|eukprot:EPY27402.1 hypothetical protein STCU_05769 [Strigomonas culicis]
MLLHPGRLRSLLAGLLVRFLLLLLLRLLVLLVVGIALLLVRLFSVRVVVFLLLLFCLRDLYDFLLVAGGRLRLVRRQRVLALRVLQQLLGHSLHAAVAVALRRLELSQQRRKPIPVGCPARAVELRHQLGGRRRQQRVGDRRRQQRRRAAEDGYLLVRQHDRRREPGGDDRPRVLLRAGRAAVIDLLHLQRRKGVHDLLFAQHVEAELVPQRLVDEVLEVEGKAVEETVDLVQRLIRLLHTAVLWQVLRPAAEDADLRVVHRHQLVRLHLVEVKVLRQRRRRRRRRRRVILLVRAGLRAVARVGAAVVGEGYVEAPDLAGLQHAVRHVLLRLRHHDAAVDDAGLKAVRHPALDAVREHALERLHAVAAADRRDGIREVHVEGVRRNRGQQHLQRAARRLIRGDRGHVKRRAGRVGSGRHEDGARGADRVAIQVCAKVHLHDVVAAQHRRLAVAEGRVMAQHFVDRHVRREAQAPRQPLLLRAAVLPRPLEEHLHALLQLLVAEVAQRLGGGARHASRGDELQHLLDCLAHRDVLVHHVVVARGLLVVLAVLQVRLQLLLQTVYLLAEEGTDARRPLPRRCGASGGGRRRPRAAP